MTPFRVAALVLALFVTGCSSKQGQEQFSVPSETTDAADASKVSKDASSRHRSPDVPAANKSTTPGTSKKLYGKIVRGPSAKVAQSGYGQITLQNNTSMTLDLYVDGGYQCETLKNLFCTSEVPAGSHGLEAKTASGQTVKSDSVTLNAGDSVTWTLTEE